MSRKPAKDDEKILILKVTASDWEGRVRGMPYRVIAIPEKMSLYDLAEIIIESFGFDFDHAFGFYSNIKRWPRSDEGYELFTDIGEGEQFPGVKKVKVGKVFNQAKKKMLFLFDYGDEWHFITQLMRTEEPKENEKYPAVLESYGEIEQYGYYDEEYEGDDEECEDNDKVV
ncbi:MAG: plasmid pRiA4b ORF-3 family protein [Tepidanaerobacteraceae bacterium]|jgi:hypothetical protein|nr:plasmid pRiA4b ORF-3 family protein [Tepidanaerobacteraceae bacterium]